jgi:hypothetical protein
MHLTAIIRPYCSDNRNLDEMEMDMMQINPEPRDRRGMTAIGSVKWSHGKEAISDGI